MAGTHPLLSLAACVGVCFLTVAIPTFFTDTSPGQWYASLHKPSWNPPNWVFSPVWTVLYLMMGIALWLVWRERGLSGAPLAYAVFALQLALNSAWSWLFFTLHSPAAALADIALLWAAIVGTLVLFWPVSATAGVLLVPYLTWVSFASGLNYALWRMNR